MVTINAENNSIVPPRRRSWAGLALVPWLALLCAGCSTPQPADKELKLLAEARQTIQRNYVQASATQNREMTYGAIGGMVDSLGDNGHSTFLTPAMVKSVKQIESGKLKGIGIEIQTRQGRIVVVSPIEGSPAERAGIRPGEMIVKVGDQDVTEWPLSRVAERITGPSGSKVSLTLEDPKTARLRTVTLTRRSIALHQVSWGRLPGTSVTQLRIASFDGGVTRDLRAALKTMLSESTEAIILDLRNNPGGLLSEAVGVASQFLETGDVLVARDAQRQTESVPVEKGALCPQIPLVLLVNEGSASAAEIVAGALQDAGRARLVGDTTFGTGTVLKQFDLSDGSALLLAVEEWLTPKGRSFWHKGLEPDVKVLLAADVDPLFPNAVKGMSPEQLRRSQDKQLLTALDLVSHPGKYSLVPAQRLAR
jgi:carboxyl-terminal processing protease